jgi:hypothetical protein
MANDNSPDLEQKSDSKAAATPQREGVSKHLLPPSTSRPSSRRNVRDLSIDTKLAAPQKLFVKVGCHPVDAPASTSRRESSASTAEIVNTPASVASSTGTSPRAASYNINEIMDLFKDAYASSQMTNPNPTFESLQDAIVREINSHDALLQFHPYNVIPESPEPALGETEDICVQSKSRDLTRRNSTKSISIKASPLVSLDQKKTSLGRQRRSSEVLGRQLSLTALKNDESDQSFSPESGGCIRRHNSVQMLSVKVGHKYALSEGANREGKPVILQDIAPNLASPKRRLDAISAKRPQCINTDLRPQSSQSFLSKKISISLAISEASKWPHPRRSLRFSHGFRLAGKHTAAARPDDVSRPPHTDPPLIYVSHADDQNTTESPAPSDVKNLPSTFPTNPERFSVKRHYYTSQFTAGRSRIPLRRSSLQKDFFDSGRFRW